MSNYTPTTEDIRENVPWMPEQFDRWLAKVKAEAWEEGYSTGLIEYANKVTFNPYGYAQHPYRQGEEQ